MAKTESSSSQVSHSKLSLTKQQILINDPLQKEEIENFLRKESGLDFELQTKKILMAHNDLVTRHGGYYLDPVEKVERQFDFRTFCQTPAFEQLPPIRFELTLECKHLAANSALLVSRVPRERHEAVHNIVCSSFVKPSTSPMGIHSGRDESNVVPSYGLYKKGEPVGKEINHVVRVDGNSKKGGTQDQASFAIKGGDKEIHPRWTQALASMAELIDMAWNRDSSQRREPGQVMFIPVLIVPNGRLWHVDYDAEGCIAEGPESCNEVDMYVERTYTHQEKRVVVTHLKILTLTGLEEFLKRVVGEKEFRGNHYLSDVCFAEALQFSLRQR